MAQLTHFRVARSIEDQPFLANKLEAICSEQIEQDFSSGVLMPVMNGSEDHLMRGAPRYKVIRSLALPILDIVRPEPPYRRVFNHAAMRFDDGSNTVDAQVTKKITERWLAMDPDVDQSNIIVESNEIVTDSTNDGYRLSAAVENGEAFGIDFDVVQKFLSYIGSMNAYRDQRLDFGPAYDDIFVPKIPLVKFSRNVTDIEVANVHAQFQSELPLIFRVGEIMPPKIY